MVSDRGVIQPSLHLRKLSLNAREGIHWPVSRLKAAVSHWLALAAAANTDQLRRKTRGLCCDLEAEAGKAREFLFFALKATFYHNVTEN